MLDLLPTVCARDYARVVTGVISTLCMGVIMQEYHITAGVGVREVLLSGSFYMCPTVECILSSEIDVLHNDVIKYVIITGNGREECCGS